MAQRRARARLLKAFSTVLSVALLGGLLWATPAAATPVVEQDPVFTEELSRLGDRETYGALVHLAPEVAAPRSFLSDRGFSIHDVFETVDVYYVTGRAADFRKLTEESAVTYLEANRKLQLRDETHAWATGARIAQESVAGGPYLDAQGRRLTGAGVGVAIVDSGVNGVHPDLEKRMVKNFKWHCASLALSSTSTERCYGATVFLGEVQGTSDTTSGHGTHVAGIVAGDGTASDGYFKGVAPRASLYGFGVGEVIFVANAAEAFEYILANNHDRSKLPVPIKVINNSWGDDDVNGDPNVEGPAYRANSLLAKLTKRLVDSGVTMVFAAGNGDNASAGMDGSHYNTSSTCQDPTPGVICVANYNDASVGTKSGALNTSSSRGKVGVPATYPDVAAPGTDISSACIRQVQPICNLGIIAEARWAPYYGTISGTSMASPHVAGVVAMLLQARPDLTPAEIENVLQDTALKFQTKDRFGNVVAYEPDPQNPDATTSYDKGAGLVDVPALLAAVGMTGESEFPALTPITGDGGDFPGPGAADIVGLSVAEEAAGMRYAIQVRNVADVASGTSLRLTQLVNGMSWMTSVNLNANGATAPAASTTNTAIATEVAVNRTNNTVTFLLPFAALGNPGPNTPAHNVYVLSYVNAIADMAPGGLGAELFVRPRLGRPYTIHPVTPDPAMPTEIAFTTTSASSGQYTDTAVLEARLTQGVSPIAEAPVAFTIGGLEVSSTTDAAGVAQASIPLDQVPGAYTASVRYPGIPSVHQPDSSTMPFALLKESVSVDFTAASPSSGQYSDETFVAARVTDDDGTRVDGESVVITLGDSVKNAALADGLGSARFPLTAAPGLYTRSVTFAENDYYTAADETGQFEILQEVTRLTLRVSGKGANRKLTATLLDDDGTALSGRTVQFSAEGVAMPNGTEVTDVNGVAVYYPAGKYSSAKSYSASYAGDGFYRGSTSG